MGVYFEQNIGGSMAKRLYILNIEFDEDTEEIEYIQEEVIDAPGSPDTQVIGSLSEDDIYDKDSLDIIRKYYDGEIGES